MVVVVVVVEVDLGDRLGDGVDHAGSVAVLGGRFFQCLHQVVQSLLGACWVGSFVRNVCKGEYWQSLILKNHEFWVWVYQSEIF